jgi:hypothetical protein
MIDFYDLSDAERRVAMRVMFDLWEVIYGTPTTKKAEKEWLSMVSDTIAIEETYGEIINNLKQYREQARNYEKIRNLLK